MHCDLSRLVCTIYTFMNFKFDKNYGDVKPQGKLNAIVARPHGLAVDKFKLENLHAIADDVKPQHLN